jgi:predicted nucleic acid-binding protein
MLLVLDAGVAVKWFLPPQDEDLIPEALSLLRQHGTGAVQFIVPDLFWAEVASVTWAAVRRQRWSSADAVKALAHLIGYGLPSAPSNRLAQRALAITLSHGNGIYDNLYVALAQESNCDLVTADERLVKALGCRFPVRWLGSFSIT